MNRLEFTSWWEGLNTQTRSAVISVGAAIAASLLLWGAKTAFPDADFSQVEIVLVTAFSGFLVSFIKEKIRL
jgi:hypothetical protein